MEYQIIAIGDELLIGQVTDTNSGNIAKMLIPHGWNLRGVTVTGDNAADIKATVTRALAAADVVLVTGGLGPTRDDITKQVMCDIFGGTLRHDEAVEQAVMQVFARRGLSLNELTLSQAMVPTSCDVIINEVGTAPIMWFERDGKVLVNLPGVPHEALTMMSHAVLPRLLERFPSTEHLCYKTLLVAGIFESRLAERLTTFEGNMPEWVKLAYLPQPGMIRLRLSGHHSDKPLLETTIDALAAQLHDELGPLIIADEDIPVSQVLGRALEARSLTMGTAESCTGGNIAHAITAIAGSSAYFKGGVVAYSNDVKRDVLGVSAGDLARHGAVSEHVVRQMALGATVRLGVDCAIATSGIAGPGGGTPAKPVGTVWMAAAVHGNVVTACKRYPGDRARVIARATNDAQLLLLDLLSRQ